MNIRHITLNNDYEFKYYCNQKSVEAFEFAIQSQYPLSHSKLFLILISDTLNAPFYLARKSFELAIDIFRVIDLKMEEPTIKWSVQDLTEMIAFQLFIPYICLAIRLSAIALGFISPSLTLRGWKIAEDGESFSYLFWTNLFKEAEHPSIDRKVFQEIQPSNAIYYLGKHSVHHALKKSQDDQEIDNQIILKFEVLLHSIAQKEPLCFYTLLNPDQIAYPQVTIGKSHTLRPISHDVKKILLNFKSFFPHEKASPKEVINQLKQHLSIQEMHRLFIHIKINIDSLLMESNMNFNKEEIKNHFIDLKNLFSTKFEFGRAHLPFSFYNIHCSSLD